MLIHRILVALDVAPHGRALSRGSRLAADHALALAPTLGASVLLLHSSASDEVWDEPTGRYVDVPEGLNGLGRAALDAALERFLDAGIPADLAISPERPALAIIQRVLSDGIDLVISGKRNEPGPGRPWLGSVSRKLLRKCPCPVWVVKPDCEPSPRHILAATDLTAVGDRVVEVAILVADRCDAALHLVHTFQRPLAVQMEDGAEISRFAREQIARRRLELERQIADARYAREVTIDVGIDSPTNAILACNERLDPDLVVMGTVSRGGIAGFLVGNTAERLLDRLDCSLLTVKPDDFVCPVSPGSG
jgi:universal stress protein E